MIFPDFGNDLKLYYNENTGDMEYFGNNSYQSGVMYSSNTFSSFAYHDSDNTIISIEYFSKVFEAVYNQETKDYDQTLKYYDCQADSEITEEEYNSLKENLLANLTDMNLTYKFIDIRDLSKEEIKQSLIESYNTFSYTDSIKNLSESELKAKLEEYGTVSAWEYHDYDGNGTDEAFAVVTDENNSDKQPDVYFVASDGAVKNMPAGFNGYYYENTEKYSETEGKGFFSFDVGGGGSGWDTLLYSVKDNEPYELDISRELQGFYQNIETGKFYTTVSDFSSGHHEWPEYDLIYDSNNQQFRLGERLDGVVSEDVTSGKCGDNANWNFDTSTGILTISGTGRMYDYATIISEVPWKVHRKNIKRVIVEEGITEFYFDYNLNNYPEMDSYVLPKSVSYISGIDNTIYRPTKDVTIYGYSGTESEVYAQKYEMTFYPLNGEIFPYISCPDSMIVSKQSDNGTYDTNIISASLTVKNDGKYDLTNVFVNLNLPDGVRCDDINAGYEEWNGMNVPKSLPESFTILDDKNEQMKFSLKQNEELTFNLVLYVDNEVLDRNKTNYAHIVQENIVTFSAEIGAYDENNTNADTQDIVSVISTPTETIPKSFNIVHNSLVNNELNANDVFHFSNTSIDYLNYKYSSQKDYKKKYGKDAKHYWYDSDGKRYYANDFSELELADGEKNEYQISDSALNKLLKGFDDNIVKAYVKKKQKNEWGGSCFGMSTVVSLVKGGYLSLSDLGLNSDITKLALPKNNSKVEDLVNFYFLQQFLPNYQNEAANLIDTVGNTTALEEFVQETKKVAQGGLPVRINYSYKGTKSGTTEEVSGGHSVVGYKCECVAEMDSNGNHRVVANESAPDFHEYRITIYDCAQTSSNDYSPTYMYIGKNYDYWWYDPINQGNNITEQTIYVISSSLEELNLVDYTTGAKSSICSEHYETNWLASHAKEGNVHIRTSNASSKLSGLGEGEGNLYTYTIPDTGTALEDEEGNVISCNSYTTYFDDDFKDEDIMLTLENADECDFSMIYTNCMVSAGGSNLNKVDMKSVGAVDLIADNSDYELSLTFNEGYYTMPWYTITANGDEANDVSMKQTEEGIVFNSDNMENVTVTANNTDEEVKLTFTADTDNVLITNNKNDLEVYADADNNGTYETLVKTTSSVVNNNNQNSSNSSSNNTTTSSPKTGDSIPKVFTSLAVATLGAVFSRKRNKSNKI